jgi:glycosyltransferase involved in cell wall biosynthesis
MRILLLSAGSSVHTVRWANAFVERGKDVHLVTQHAVTSGLSPRVHVHELSHWSGLGYLANGRRLRRLIRSIAPDVANVHYASGYGSLVEACKPIPTVLNVWGSDVFDFPRKSALHRWWLQRNLRAADQLVSTSKAMAERTRALAPGKPIAVVPFGVDLDVFGPAGPRTGTEQLTIGTVKSLMPVYGVDTLIRAFAGVLKMVPDRSLRLRIVGRGPQASDLERLATSLGIRDRVDLIGGVRHAAVPDELRKIDVFVALSREESFGVAVIEASACGLPVVVSNVGGLPEVVREGITGSVVPPDDPEAAAHAIAELIASPEKRKTWGEAGRAFVAEHYAWPSCVDRMLDVLTSTSRIRR